MQWCQDWLDNSIQVVQCRFAIYVQCLTWNWFYVSDMQKYHMIAYVLLYQKWWILQPPLILAVLSKWPFRPSLKLVALPRRTNFWNSFLAGASLSLGECNYPTGKQLKPHARVDGANTSHVLVTGLVHPFFSTKLGSGDRVHWSYVSIVFLSCLRYVEFKVEGDSCGFSLAKTQRRMLKSSYIQT